MRVYKEFTTNFSCIKTVKIYIINNLHSNFFSILNFNTVTLLGVSEFDVIYL